MVTRRKEIIADPGLTGIIKSSQMNFTSNYAAITVPQKWEVKPILIYALLLTANCRQHLYSSLILRQNEQIMLH